MLIFLHQLILFIAKRKDLKETICRKRTVSSGKIAKHFATIWLYTVTRKGMCLPLLCRLVVFTQMMGSGTTIDKSSQFQEQLPFKKTSKNTSIEAVGFRKD